MNSPELPLWELFTRLQAAGLPLGIEEYRAVLRALQAGRGVDDRDALRRLCSTVWLNSPQEQRIFNDYFDQTFAPAVAQQPIIPAATPQRSRPRRWRRLAMILSAIVLISAGLGVFLLLNNPQEQQPASPEQLELEQIPDPQNPQAPLDPEIPPPPTSDRRLLIIALLLLILLTGLAFWWWRRRQTAKRIRPNTVPKTISQVLMAQNTDEIQVAQAIQRQRTAQKGRRFFSQAYFPVTRRQMKQSWRYLRRFNREGRKTELDLAATVQQIGRQGLLLKPVLRSPRVNHTELVLLLDTDGSMVPFQRLAQNLETTATTAGRLRRTTVYFFHNCPGAYLYRDRYHLDGVRFEQVLASHDPRWTVVLIFSDGGAARRGFNPARVRQTAAVVHQLQAHFRQVVWVNPLPEARWAETTAGAIAEQLPMLELSRQGFQGAIDILRGRSPS
ncbi:MAG: VWA domain-containing protein [Spirulinaceae cyanobacterium]